METERKTLKQLFIPICLETLFYMLSGMVDTLMLSYIGDNAVGAVGTANTYIGIFIIAFSVISSGMIAVMTQNIGAGKPGVAYQARQVGLIFNAVLGIILASVLYFFADKILDIVGIAADLKKYASDYLKIVGGFCFLNAVIPVFSGYLRAFGYTKQCLFATITANVLNLILNALFLMVFHKGVKGVATATVISRVVNLLMLIFWCVKLVKAHEDTSRIPNKNVLLQIVKIGFPSAMETALYNFAMTLVIRFLNKMDTAGLNATARSYAAQITNFAYSVGAALAAANAIMTGWRIGENKYDECYKETCKAAIRGICVAVPLETLLAICSRWIMLIFTHNPVMINLVQQLLFIDIALEIGRVSNLVFGNALKTSGDAVFPVVLGAVFMYLMAVLGTYVFGIKLGLNAVGAYIGLALDECSRAVGMFLRWKKGRWRKMSLVNKE